MASRALDFSIVIPTYRRPAQLSRCLGAVAVLDYPRDRFEVIVVDDGSEAPPRDVVRAFESRLDVRLLERPHGGPAAARNAGAADARGATLAFTDDDCLPDRQWLAVLRRHADTHPGHAIGGRTINALEGNVFAEASQSLLDFVVVHYEDRPDGEFPFFGSANVAIPVDRFRDVGGFDGSFAFASEDRDFFDRWRAQGFAMSYAPDAIVRHAHDLTFTGLFRQQFAYGRGRFDLQTAQRRRGAAPVTLMPASFYRELVLHPVGTRERGVTIAALHAYAQSALLCGYLWERAINALRPRTPVRRR